MTMKASRLGACAVAAAMIICGPAAAAGTPVGQRAAGAIKLVSVTPAGEPADGFSQGAAINGDGRYVAFFSLADDLVEGDDNGHTDVFLLDRTSGITTLISRSAGEPSDGSSMNPSISADGRFVAYHSDATNLVAGDGNGRFDVFVYDRETGETTLDSPGRHGAGGNGASIASSISDDGRYVAFHSDASNLVAGDANGSTDVFVRDRSSGTTRLVSRAEDGGPSDGNSLYASMSGDGSLIAYTSVATNLVTADGNGTWDVFLWDAATGTTRLVSARADGSSPRQISLFPSLSGDGKIVAYETRAPLVAPDRNHTWDVYAYDIAGDTVTLVSQTADGSAADGRSEQASTNETGTVIGFTSHASDLAADDHGRRQDVFVRDLDEGSTSVISRSFRGGRANGKNDDTVISADGHFVAFESVASNLVRHDDNDWSDVFLRRLSAS
jgi:Tol biopolymer transport system component